MYFSLAFKAKCPLVGEELPLFTALPMEATDDTVDVTVEDTLAAARRTKSPVKFILSTCCVQFGLSIVTNKYLN